MKLYRSALAVAVLLLVVSPALAQGDCQADVKILGEEVAEDEWGGSEHVASFELQIRGCAESAPTSGQLTYQVTVKGPDSDDPRVVANACDWPNEQSRTLQLSCKLPLDVGQTVVGQIRVEDVYVYCYCLG